MIKPENPQFSGFIPHESPMAYIYKLPSGKWRAQVQLAGARASQSFHTKAAATEWAVDRERMLRLHGSAVDHTLHDVLKRYRDEVTPKHRGKRWESIFIEAIMRPTDRYGEPKAHLPDVPLRELSTKHLARWRDQRLREVMSASVAREWHVVRAALNVARKEWKWLAHDPTDGFASPSPGQPRDKVLSQDEIDAIVEHLGGLVLPPGTSSQQIAVVFLIALETGMRKGEILGLTQRDIKGSVARLSITKNGTARDVPLSTRARELCACAPFTVSSGVADTLFRRAVRAAGLDDVHFHDSRHTAATRLAGRLSLLELCRMCGWKNPKQAMTYFNKSAADIAKLLD